MRSREERFSINSNFLPFYEWCLLYLCIYTPAIRAETQCRSIASIIFSQNWLAANLCSYILQYTRIGNLNIHKQKNLVVFFVVLSHQPSPLTILFGWYNQINLNECSYWKMVQCATAWKKEQLASLAITPTTLNQMWKYSLSVNT